MHPNNYDNAKMPVFRPCAPVYSTRQHRLCSRVVCTSACEHGPQKLSSKWHLRQTPVVNGPWTQRVNTSSVYRTYWNQLCRDKEIHSTSLTLELPIQRDCRQTNFAWPIAFSDDLWKTVRILTVHTRFFPDGQRAAQCRFMQFVPQKLDKFSIKFWIC